MKIGIYNPFLDSLSGGERYMLTIASALQHDHHVSVFWDDAEILNKAEKKLGIDLSRVSVVHNLFQHRSFAFSSPTKSYDLIIALSDGSIPRISSRFGIMHFQRPFYNVNGSSFFNQIKLKKYGVVLCNSIYTKKYIDREYHVDSMVLYPPVPIPSIPSTVKKSVILSVGRFHPFKKHMVMIDAFKSFSKDHNGWQLVLAGGLLDADQSYFDTLQNETKNLSISLRPNCALEEIQKLYRESSVYWHAAGYGEDDAFPENFEHFGIAPVEAMAAGCIPVVFNGGGLPEIITNGTHGYLWNSTEELIEKTAHSIDEKHISLLRKEAIARSADFSEASFVKQINTIVSRLS